MYLVFAEHIVGLLSVSENKIYFGGYICIISFVWDYYKITQNYTLSSILKCVEIQKLKQSKRNLEFVQFTYLSIGITFLINFNKEQVTMIFH